MATGSRGMSTRVILLPGMLGTIANDWKPHFEAILDAGFEPVGIDWPGHGNEDADLEAFTLQSLVDHVLARIDTITDEPVLIWGYDLGGYVALEIERQLPGRCSAIWMHATKFFWNDDEIDAFHANNDLATMSSHRKETLVKIHGDRWQKLLQVNLDLFEEIIEFGLTLDDLEGIRLPVLVSTGNQDEFVPTEDIEQLADELIAGEPSIIPGVRHPLHSTRSSLIIPVAEEFSRRVLV